MKKTMSWIQCQIKSCLVKSTSRNERKSLALAVMIVLALSFITSPQTIFGATFNLIGEFGRGPSNAPGEFNYPSGIGIDPSTGDVYVMDEWFNRIQKFDANGNYVTHWKSSGGSGVAVDQNSHAVYVASPRYHKISRYNQNGQLLNEWGSYGTDDGQFNEPRDIAINPINENVFVIDSGNKRVQEFDSNGNFSKTWGGNFNRPYGISIDPNGQFVYVANTGGASIHKFNIDGTFVKKWGGRGSEPGQFRWPRGVSVGRDGDVYVADTDMERVQKFDSDGNFLEIIQGPHNSIDGPFHPRALDVNLLTSELHVAAAYAHRIDRFKNNEMYDISWGHHEQDGPVFNQPKGIAVDHNSGDVFIADTGNHLFKRFSKDGDFIKQFGGNPRVAYDESKIGFPAPTVIDSKGSLWAIHQGIHYADDPTWGSDKYVRQLDSDGNFLFGFANPDFGTGMRGLAIESSTGDIYVANTPKNKIMKFDSSGNSLLEFGGLGSAPSEFNAPAGIALDNNGESLFVVDTGNQRVQHLTLDGNYLGGWGSSGDGPGEFSFGPYSNLDIDEFGYIYVADSKNGRIQIFDADGNYITEVGSYGWGSDKFAWPASVAVHKKTMYVLDTGGNEVELYQLVAPSPPVIDGIGLNGCISELCKSTVSLTAHDPQGGTLRYTWTSLNGGTIIGTGASVLFDPPDAGPHPCPYRVKVTVTSSVSDLSTEQVIEITVKLAGDVDGNGVVNVLDKFHVRNHLGESGAPGWIDVDVNCDGFVNVLDKIKVRDQFGQSGCACP